jgi:hypothetical protein
MNIPPPAGQRLHPPSRRFHLRRAYGGQDGATSAPLERLRPNPKLKFMERCREVRRFHRLALRTEEAYWQWIKRFI